MVTSQKVNIKHMQVQVREMTIAEKGAGEGATSSASGGGEKKGSCGRRSIGRTY